MTFDEWLEAYYSGTQIDDVVTGMMRTAFEAGKEDKNGVEDLRKARWYLDRLIKEVMDK